MNWLTLINQKKNEIQLLKREKNTNFKSYLEKKI